MGHSYVGLTVVLYAMRYPDRVNRIVQLGPIQPHYGKQYPSHLMCADATRQDVLDGLGELEKERPSLDPSGVLPEVLDAAAGPLRRQSGRR